MKQNPQVHEEKQEKGVRFGHGYTNTFINKVISSEPPGGQPARRIGASIARLW